MNPSRSGILYLFIVISHVLGELLIALAWHAFPYMSFPGTFVLSFGEILIILPLVICVIAFRADIRETFRVNKVSLLTLILVIPFTYLMFPLVALFNAITLLFTRNVVSDMSDVILSVPFAVTFSLIAVFGPFTEEITFRGATYAGFKKSGNIRRAIFMQAFLFGLMHMNLNQFLYAFVIGLAFGVLSEVSGSILPSFFSHLIINGTTTVSMYFVGDTTAESFELSKAEIWMAIQSYALISLFTVSIAVLLLFLIASVEKGGRERLERILRPVKRHEIIADGNYVEAATGRVVSIPLVIGILLSAAIIVISLIMEY